MSSKYINLQTQPTAATHIHDPLSPHRHKYVPYLNQNLKNSNLSYLSLTSLNFSIH